MNSGLRNTLRISVFTSYLLVRNSSARRLMYRSSGDGDTKWWTTLVTIEVAVAGLARIASITPLVSIWPVRPRNVTGPAEYARRLSNTPTAGWVLFIGRRQPASAFAPAR